MGPITAAIILYLLPFNKAAKYITAITQGASLALAFYIFAVCRENALAENPGGFASGLGIKLEADNLSSIFLMLSAVIFLVASLYNWNDKPRRLFWFLMLLWQGTLNGVFLTTDLFNLFVLVEVATVIVSMLIMFHRRSRSVRDGMLYLMVNTVAIQFYLLGIGYIYKLTGTLDMRAATAFMVRFVDRSDLLLPYALIMTFVCLKCALVPLFSWLPKAHGTPGAPSSVSAILSGLHIKCGIYMFIRFKDFFPMIDLSAFFIVAGIVTGIAGFILALSQTDIKLILAYSTVSQIGMIMIGLNLDDVYAYSGGVYHIVNHAFFKAALFMCAGIISQAYGTRNIRRIKGLMKRMPVVGATMLMAIAGITGAPFFSGSVSKYFILSGVDTFMNTVIIFMNLGTLCIFIKYSTMLFGGKTELPETTQRISPPMKNQSAAVLLLGVLCFAGGIFGERLIQYMLNADLTVTAAGYLQKTAIYFVSLGAAVLIYRLYVRRSAFLGYVRTLEIGFRGICILIGVTFALILITAAIL
jgi:multicomponent Na+:H+ antiporter subunit D